MAKLFGTSILRDSQGSALDFITNLPQASTEYSLIEKDSPTDPISFLKTSEKTYEGLWQRF